MRLKFNNGRGAVICDNCSTVIYSGFNNFPKDISDAIERKDYDYGPIFCCEKCEKEYNEKHVKKI